MSTSTTRYLYYKYKLEETEAVTQGDLLMSSGSKKISAISSTYYHVWLCSEVTYDSDAGTWTASGTTKHGIYSDASGTSTSDCVSYSAETYPYVVLTSSSSSKVGAYCFVTTGSYWYFHASGSSISNCKNLYLYAYSGSIYYAEMGTEYSKGDLITSILSTADSTKYPEDGVSGSYWYVLRGSDAPYVSAITLTPTTPVGGETLTIKLTRSATYNSSSFVWSYDYWYYTDGDSSNLTKISRTTGTTVTLDVPSGAETLTIRAAVYADGYGWVNTTGYTSKTVSVTNYTAPTAPEEITAEGGTYDGMIFTDDTITVTWSESTDEDDDLTGYIVQRSYNGGSYSTIYQGSALTCTDTPSSTWTTVQYRVQAYDSQSLYSDYTYSDTYTVSENSAPSAPAAVTITSSIYVNVQFTVSWTASTDPDGDTVYYEYSASYDGGSTWAGSTTGLTGTSTAATITNTSVTQVQYRVRAYDMYGAYSDWTYSSTRTVISNTAPTLSVGAGSDSLYDDGYDFGTFTDAGDAPVIGYIHVEDADDDDISYTFEVDSTTVSSGTLDCSEDMAYDEDNSVYYFSWIYSGTTACLYGGSWLGSSGYQKLLNGEHTITITVSDGTETVTWTGTFTKAVDSCTIGKAAAVSTGSTITGVLMSITGSIPDDATVTVKVTADGTNWEDASTEVLAAETYYFTNTGDSFDFEVSIDGNGTDGYVTSIQGVLITE